MIIIDNENGVNNVTVMVNDIVLIILIINVVMKILIWY